MVVIGASVGLGLSVINIYVHNYLRLGEVWMRAEAMSFFCVCMSGCAAVS